MKSPNMKAEKIGKNKLRLNIYDQIGPSWLGMIDGKAVADALDAAGDVKQIDVHVNSPGGSVFEGVAIYNILKDHPAKVRMKVDGVAASSASVVLMAGDEIEVPRNAPVMIHNPVMIAAGGQSEMQKTADFLGKVKDSIVQTYAERTKKSPEELAAMMDEETWMYGDDAVKNGFADRVVGDLKIAPVAAPSNYTMPFKNAPENFFSLVALASGNSKPEVKKMSDSIDADKAALELKAKQEAEAKAAAEAQAKAEVEAKAKQDAELKAAVEAANKRAADITAACNKARKPELAVKFIAENKSLADVNALLLDQLCASNAPGDDGNGGPDMNKDENSAYKAEYEANPYLKGRMSFKDFVATRRVDEGKDKLQAAAK